MPDISKQFIPWTDLQEGWHDRDDTVKSPGLSTMENVFITDRGGVAPRPGVELLGAANVADGPTISTFTAVRRDGTNILLRSFDQKLEYYNTLTSSWHSLHNSYTSGKVFGFANHNLNTDDIDYLYFGNGVEPLSRWTMAFDQTDGVLAGGETEIGVDTTLTDEVYHTGTATGVTGTTLTDTNSSWATNEWDDGFYVRITNGAAANSISPISSNTANVLTFTAIAGLAGTPTYEIRRLKFSATGTVIVNTSTVAYTQIVKDNELPVTSAPAAADNSPIAEVPEELKANGAPRGNILKTLFQVLNVAGTADYPSTIYTASLTDASDFTSSSPRLAGEGDVINVPDGGGKIYDLEVFEDKLIVMKESYIEQITRTQDANDLVDRVPLVNSPLIGTRGRAWKMGNDIMFANTSNEITTLQRSINRDQRPLAANLAFPIKRGIRKFDFTQARGRTFRNYTLVACKKTSNSTNNDLIIVFDNNRQKWIGEWIIPAADFAIYNDALYLGSSASPEIYKMFHTENTTVKGNDTIGYDTLVETQWENKTKSGFGTQTFTTLAISGYITDNTTIGFSLFYDFGNSAAHSWTFDPITSSDQVLAGVGELSLGGVPLGVTPLGVDIGEEEGDFGERRFIVYFRVPMTEHVWSKLQWSSSGTNQYYEITDISANFTELANTPIHKYTKSFED